MQTEESFRRRGVSADSRGRARLSELIRQEFTSRNQPYSATWTQATPKALRFLRPESDAAQSIKWWVDERCPVGGEYLILEPAGTEAPQAEQESETSQAQLTGNEH